MSSNLYPELSEKLMTQFNSAIENNHEVVVRQFLSHVLPQGKRLPSELQTLIDVGLILAADKGYEDIAKLLIKRGANLNNILSAGPNGVHSPLLAAARGGHANMVRLLCENGVNPNTSPEVTPLHIAATTGNIDVLNALVDCGIKSFNLEAGVDCGPTALHLAIALGNDDVALALISIKDVDLNMRTVNTIEGYESCKEHQEYVESLVRSGKLSEEDSDKLMEHGSTTLILAVSIGNESIVKALIAAGASLNETSSSLIKVTDESVTRYEGVNVNDYIVEDGLSALICALQEGKFRIASELISAGADVHQKLSSDNTSVLWYAAMYDNVDIVEELISRGAKVNESSVTGMSPLTHACFHNNINVVKALISAGADVKHKSPKFGFTPLSTAEERGFDKIVQILKEAGAASSVGGNLIYKHKISKSKKSRNTNRKVRRNTKRKVRRNTKRKVRRNTNYKVRRNTKRKVRKYK